MKTAGIFLQDLRLALLARQVGVHVQDLLGVQERELLGQVGVVAGLQLREQLLDVRSAPLSTFQIFDDVLQEVEVALVGGDHALPVPLVHVGAVVVIEEVVLADGAHVGAQALARLHAELLQRHALPLGGRLDHLGVDRVLVVVVGDVELDRACASRRGRA